ncbi:hypothetical protein GGI42DRAFT_353075 [Trichoderma sp. SZMC 28013]
MNFFLLAFEAYLEYRLKLAAIAATTITITTITATTTAATKLASGTWLESLCACPLAADTTRRQWIALTVIICITTWGGIALMNFVLLAFEAYLEYRLRLAEIAAAATTTATTTITITITTITATTAAATKLASAAWYLE